MPRTLTLAVPDGRTLEAVDEGDPDGTLLLFHHGSPGAAVAFEPFGAEVIGQRCRIGRRARDAPSLEPARVPEPRPR